MDNMSMIGARFELLRPMLGAKVGDIGYVFNQYTDFDYPDEIGVQIIFSNGEYDGFSADEQKIYLKHLGFDLNYVGYQFKNVIQVSKDFREGYWKW